MTRQYPESWSQLRFQSRRSELLFTLDDIINLESEAGATQNDREIDFIVHFLFDDTDLAEDPASEVGNTLFDDDEAEAVKSVTSLLDLMISEIGDKADKDFLAHHSWDTLIDRAKKALDMLSAKGLPISWQARQLS